MLEAPDEDQSFPHKLERRLVVRYKDVVVGDYDADLIGSDSVLVELKISPQYDKRDEAQLLNLLKATGMKVGLLINFGRSKVEFKRLVF
jgi:GxxExxY protein